MPLPEGATLIQKETSEQETTQIGGLPEGAVLKTVEPQKVDPSLPDWLKYRVDQGNSSLAYSKLGGYAMWGYISNDDAIAKGSAIKNRMAIESNKYDKVDPFTPKGALGAAAQMLPYLASSAFESGKTGLLAGMGMGTMAFTAGQAPGLTVLPEEVFTVPAAFAAGMSSGMTYGVVKHAWDNEGGSIYLDLIQNGVSPDKARMFAMTGGFGIGLSELMQFSSLSKPYMKVVSNTLKSKIGGSAAVKAVANYFKNWGFQVAQEEAQEIVSLTAESMAYFADNKGDKAPTKQEWIDRLSETAKESAVGMAVIGLPGAAVDYTTMKKQGINPRTGLHNDTAKAVESLKAEGELTVIPELKNTNEAHEYGLSIKDNPAQIKAVSDKYEANLMAIRNMDQTETNLNEQFLLAQKNQFYREAVEAATNTGSFKAVEGIQKVLPGEEVKQEATQAQEQPIQEQNDIYSQNYELSKTKKKLKKSNIGEGIQSFVDKAFVPLSTRASKVSEALRTRLRKFEFDIMQRNKADYESVIPFLKKIKGISEKDFADIDLALKNRDIEKINDVTQRNKISEEYNTVKKVLDDIYKRAVNAGVDVEYLQDYFPRSIIDVSGFLDYLKGTDKWSQIDKEIKTKETEMGRLMDDAEKAAYANLLIRGYGQKTNTKKAGNIKGRKIAELSPEMNQFYKDSATSLVEYITAMNNMIEAQNLIGKNLEKLDDSIGAYVKRLIEENVIDKKQEQEVKDILRSRLQAKGTWGFWSMYKNASYLYSMSSPVSAITQIGDLYNSLYRNGVYDTFLSLSKSISRQNEVTKEDLGIENIADEFKDSSKSGKAVTAVFKAIGLDFMDSLGKNTLIESSLRRLQKEAKNNKADLDGKLVDFFGNEAKQTMEDLQNGVLSPNVKMLLFSELSDFQPISLSEMPEYYVSGGNLRVFYMLKSYTIKLLDVYHNEIFRTMKTDPVGSSQRLVRLTFALMLTGASADVLKDILLGRKIELPDIVIDNILKLMAFSKWQIYKAREDGILDTFMQSVLPPIPFLDDLYKDVVKQKELPDWEIMGKIPFVGKFYYWWFGGGRRKEERKQEKELEYK